MADFNDKENGPPCVCPVPCKRTMYDAQISYASVSNYDTDKLLQSNISKHLKQRYVQARETNHRVNEQQLHHDQTMILNLDEAFAAVDHMMMGIRDMITELGDRVHEDHHKVEDRLAFHEEWGVDKVVYIMHHDFARGYDVKHERTFSVVTPFYLEIVAYCEDLLEKFLHGNETEMQKQNMLEIGNSMLMQRWIAATRALDNMTEVYEAYNTSTPLLTYKASPSRRYDMTWITPEVVTDGSDNVIKYSEIILESLEKFRNAASNMQKLLKQAYEDKNVTREQFDKETTDFRAAVRRYNYYFFLFKERVAYKCDEIALDLQAKFKDHVKKYTTAHEELDYYVDALGDFLHDAEEAWTHLTSLRELANDYAANPTLRKTLMAEAFTSEVTNRYSNELQTFFAELRARSRNIHTMLISLQIATEELWTNLLTDTSVDKFYEKLLEDIGKLRNGTEYDTLVYAFSYMLDTSKDHIKNNTDNLEVMLNADFVTTTLDDKLVEIRNFFSELNSLNDVDNTITNEKFFFDAFNEMERELAAFLDDSNINNEFYRLVSSAQSVCIV